MHVHDGDAVIAQCRYKIEEMEGTEPSIVTFNCYRFRVWRKASEGIEAGWNKDGVWIQRILEETKEKKEE